MVCKNRKQEAPLTFMQVRVSGCVLASFMAGYCGCQSLPERSGRVFGLYGAACSSYLPMGMAVFGLLADRASTRLLMVESGGLLMRMAAVTFLDKAFCRHGSEG